MHISRRVLTTDSSCISTTRRRVLVDESVDNTCIHRLFLPKTFHSSARALQMDLMPAGSTAGV
jgi:hypothetical protein